MTKQEMYDMMNRCVGFHLATVEGDQPRVRGMMLYKAGPEGICFHTGAFKDLYRQVRQNPKAELCFSDGQGLQLRVSGRLEIVEDDQLKEEISSHPSRAFLQEWKNSVPRAQFYRDFIVLNMRGGQAVVWTMAANMTAKEPVTL